MNLLRWRRQYISIDERHYNGNLLLDHCSPIVNVTKDTANIDWKKYVIDKEPDWLIEEKRNQLLDSTSTSNRSKFVAKYQNELRELNPDKVLEVEPVIWEAFCKKSAPGKYLVRWDGSLEKGWRIYSQKNTFGDGAMNFKLSFDPGSSFTTSSLPLESGDPKLGFDKAFKTELRFFFKEALFFNF